MTLKYPLPNKYLFVKIMWPLLMLRKFQLSCYQLSDKRIRPLFMRHKYLPSYHLLNKIIRALFMQRNYHLRGYQLLHKMTKFVSLQIF